MKEMIYKDTWEQSLLEYGSYKGYHYCVVSQGVFPCGYVELSPDHAYFKQDNAIICHGGITFHGHLSDDLGLPSNTFWIGWDYGHAGDLLGFDFSFRTVAYGNGYTTEDVVAECHNVIDQLEAIKDEVCDLDRTKRENNNKGIQ